MRIENKERHREQIERLGYYIQNELGSNERVSTYYVAERNENCVFQIVSCFNEEPYIAKVEAYAGKLIDMTHADPQLFLQYEEMIPLPTALSIYQKEMLLKMQYGDSLKRYIERKELCLEDILAIGIQAADAVSMCRKYHISHYDIGEDSLYFANEKWKMGNFKIWDLNREESREESEDVYRIGLLLYKLLNEMELPFENICQTVEEAAEKRRRGEMPPFPKYGTSSLKEMLAVICTSKEQRAISLKKLRKHLEYLRSNLPKEWLEEEATGHSYRDDEYCSGEDLEEVLEETTKAVSKEKLVPTVLKKDPKKEQNKSAKVKVKKSDVQKTNDEIQKMLKKAEKEEKKRREKKFGYENTKDFLIIMGIVAAVVLIIVGTVVFVTNSGNRKAYSYIESKTYATAMNEIKGIYEDGENVDALVETYIEACLSDGEYKRISQAIPLLSEEYCEKHEALFETMIETMMNEGKETRAQQALETMAECGEIRLEYAKRLVEKYYGEGE